MLLLLFCFVFCCCLFLVNSFCLKCALKIKFLLEYFRKVKYSSFIHVTELILVNMTMKELNIVMLIKVRKIFVSEDALIFHEQANLFSIACGSLR